MSRYAIFALFILTGINASGATRTWTGASANNFWTNPFNWVDNIAPAPGDDLVATGIGVVQIYFLE